MDAEKRKMLRDKIEKESALVREESMKVLKEFEEIDEIGGIEYAD